MIEADRDLSIPVEYEGVKWRALQMDREGDCECHGRRKFYKANDWMLVTWLGPGVRLREILTPVEFEQKVKRL